MNDPAVAFAAVYPGRNRASGPQSRDECGKSFLGIGQMMQNSDGKSVVEDALERRLRQVCLHDVGVGQVARIVEGRIDGLTQIEGHNLSRTEVRDYGGVAPFAAAAFQYSLASKEIRCDGPNPIEELLPVTIRQLGVVGPF